MISAMRGTSDQIAGGALHATARAAALDRYRPRQLAALLLASGIFALDSFSQLSSAVATLYLLVLLVASGSSRTRLVCWSIGCAGLTLAGFVIVHGRAPALDPAIRLVVSLAANAATTGLLLHRQAMDRRVAQQETAMERTRIELERVQRSAAIGAMSASIAHEINQPLSAIQSYANAAKRWLARPEPDLNEARLSLEGLNLAIAAVHDVVQRVRNLVGGSRVDIAPLALETLVADSIAIAARDVAAHGATIRFTAEGAARIAGDAILLKHLLLNLITNALQAMEAANSPDRQIDVAMLNMPVAVRLLVRDRGPGLDPARTDNPFETFTTTKPGGMGLGLSICRSIVELHDGRIAIANHPDGGAIVSIDLPLAA